MRIIALTKLIICNDRKRWIDICLRSPWLLGVNPLVACIISLLPNIGCLGSMSGLLFSHRRRLKPSVDMLQLTRKPIYLPIGYMVVVKVKPTD
jgi:hypothetical protein